MSKNTIEEALKKQKELQQRKKLEQAESAITAEPKQASETVKQAEVKAAVLQASEPKVETATDVVAETATAAASTSKTLNKLDIPLQTLEDEGYVSLCGARKLVNEEFRGIKRKVLTNAFGPISATIDNSNLIMVTSASPSEGKSFSAVNLALSIALEQDKTVLLVDCDVLKPSLHKKLHVPNDKGIMEFLSGEVDDVQEIINTTNVDKLRFISAGKKHHLSTELLASHKMASLANEFVNRYPDRIVILDCPPLLGINETYVLSELAGQILVVVEEGKTKITSVKVAVSQLNKDKAIGFVMNKSTHSNQSDSGYGYGYGYGYGNEAAK